MQKKQNYLNGLSNPTNKNKKTQVVTIFRFGYGRKSTESDERQIQSIDSQIGWMRGVLTPKEFEELKLFTESKSAKDPDNREEFKNLIKGINEVNKKYKGKIKFEIHLLTWALDRLSRNPVDSGLLQYMMQKREITKIICSDRVFLHADSGMMMGMFSIVSNQFILDMQKNVARGMKDKAEKGGCIQYAPNGYINNKETNEADIDPKTAPIIVEIFNLRDDGYSLHEIVKICKDRGYKTKRGTNFSKSTIEQILKNPFYIGLQIFQGELIKANHQKLVSVELWERVNAVKRGYKKRDSEDLFPLKGIVKNYYTHKPLLAVFKREKHVYYTTNSREDHRVSISQNQIIKDFDHLIKKYEIKGFLKPYLIEIIKSTFSDEYKKLDDERNALHIQIRELNKKSNRLFDLVCNGTIMEDKYKEENARILIDLERLNEQLNILGKKDIVISEQGEFLVEHLENLSTKRKTRDSRLKLLMIKNIVVELFVTTKKELVINENKLFQYIKFLNGYYWQGP